MKKGYYVIFFLFLLPLICFAQKTQSFSGRVGVYVSANENIKGEIESYISRELRSLGDIIVTDSNPRWILNIVAMELLTKGGYKSGVVLSVIILEPFDNGLVKTLLVDKTDRQMCVLLTSNLYYYPKGHWLRVGAPGDLRNLCNGIVADFDTEYLKPARNLWQKIVDSMKKKAR